MNVVEGFGIIFLAIGGYLLLDALYLIIKCRGRAIGTLVAIEERYDYEVNNRRKRCYVPVYTYEVNGREYKNAAKLYKDSAEEYEMGSTAEVKYFPANPDVCIIGNRNGKVGCGVLAIILGIFLCFIG